MIMKRFCFEATDCYLVLLFLAFYEQDEIKVRSELVSVFHVDTFRRILLEGINHPLYYAENGLERKRCF